MKDPNYRRTGPVFFRKVHFLRLEGEPTYKISSRIVAFEDENGNFSPRRPEPGETHLDGPCFNSEEKLNEFLLDREINHVDHTRLIRDETEWGISPYWEFVEKPNALRCVQPALPSYGGFQELGAFQIWLHGDILDYRAHALAAVEYWNACRDEFRIAPLRVTSPAEIEHGTPALERVMRRVLSSRKARWFQKRKELPAGTVKFYHDAQLYLPWYDPEDNGAPTVALPDDEWA